MTPNRNRIRTVVHAADFSPPYGGNFVASLRALAASGTAEGRRYVLAFPTSAGRTDWFAELRADGFQTALLPEGGAVLETGRTLHRLCRDWDATLLHTHFSSYDVSAWIAQHLLATRGSRLQVVWHAHSDFPMSRTLSRRTRNLVKYRLMGRTTFTVAVSEHVREKMIGLGCSPHRICTIHNGIDLERPLSAVRPRTEVLDAASIPRHAGLLLLFGWEPIVKGVDTALEAAAVVTQRSPAAVLGIVGTERLHNFVGKRFTVSHPHWLRLLPPVERVADYYSAASLFLMASRNEGFPYAVCEAMAARLPVVLSDIPGVAWAHDTPGAVFFRPGDAQSLADALREVLKWTDAERRRRGDLNRTLVESRFSVTAWVERIRLLYQSILADKG